MPRSEENGEVFHDRIFDLSLVGAGIYSDTDISTEEPLVMLIETPLPDGESWKTIIGIECTLRNSLFSEEYQQFHIGVKFLRFHGIDKHLLAEALLSQKESIIRRSRRKSDSLN